MKAWSRSVSIEQLHLLPKWAVVAVAARCAERAGPTFNCWEGAKPLQQKAIDESPAMVARVSVAGSLKVEKWLPRVSTLAHSAFNDARSASPTDDEWEKTAAFAAQASVCACVAALAAGGHDGLPAEETYNLTRSAIVAAEVAVCRIGSATHIYVDDNGGAVEVTTRAGVLGDYDWLMYFGMKAGASGRLAGSPTLPHPDHQRPCISPGITVSRRVTVMQGVQP